ncbi:CG0192-related protein [Micromonospora sp. CA-244673]|uniref:CG0192-related protein n=1 Tax=Micromonospora sp. CA-244673 TaxID=3239958 RepID=UPI003D942386
MALLHRAELRPSKLDLLAAWLPGRPWFTGDPGAEVTRVAAYRFDDPAGEVGIETMLVRAGDGPVLQVPLTYRAAPLPGAERWLLGTTDHSVLGPRWVYDACGDPVYPPALAAAVLADAGQAEEYFEVDGRREVRAASMTLAGTRSGNPSAFDLVDEVVDGDPTLIRAGGAELALVRRPAPADAPAPARLTGSWSGQADPVLLAYAR